MLSTDCDEPMIPRCKEVVILGVTFQCDSKYSSHVKNKLINANKYLSILRSLRKERYKQSERPSLSVYIFILERQDPNIFKKVSNSVCHPLLSIMRCIKSPNYNLRKKATVTGQKLILCVLKTLFIINRLIFKFDLAL